LYKKSLNHHTFKQRQFVLLGEQLFYYKKNTQGQQEKYFNLIDLRNAQIRPLKCTSEKLKLSSYYKYCFEIQNDTRKWVLACLGQQDLEQWQVAIYSQIDQVAKRIAIERLNWQITDLEREKSIIDQQVVVKLIKPSAVMFDPVQKSMLIGFFTNRDIFLNKLIPMLSVYLDQTKNCNQMLQQFQQLQKNANLTEGQALELKNAYQQAYNMAENILKELKSIYRNNIQIHEDEVLSTAAVSDSGLQEQQANQGTSPGLKPVK
jgi:hypothetical protein